MVIQKSMLASVMLSGGIFYDSASTANPGDAISSATVTVKIENGIAILQGSVGSGLEKRLLTQAAAELEGVREVKNFVTFL